MMQRISLYMLGLVVLLTGCAQSDASFAPESIGSSTGQGGSLARFTIVNDYLYTLESSRLSWFAVNEGTPVSKGSVQLPEGKETIFPLDDLLFVGAQDGLTIFSVQANGQPVEQGSIFHFAACDPVVANETHAYVTLRIEGCAGIFNNRPTENVLNVYDVTNLENPTPIASYPMQSPRGLGLAGDILFLCEGEFGLKVFDVSNPLDIQLLSHRTDIHANDVIALPEQLLVIGPDNLTQFDYSDPAQLVKLSEMRIKP
ncbi:MAG: hypothetical protein KDC54_06365 [Lewinella sp.]|nr:hypothetical protein [Lewinella sp.]